MPRSMRPSSTIHLDDDGAPRIIERRFRVSPEFAGMRADHFLTIKIPRLSRTRAQRIIRTQVTRESGETIKASTRLQVGDELLQQRTAKPEPECPRHYSILHRDKDLLVINKPAGLPMHISARYYFNTLMRIMAETLPQERLSLCHRLDKETSGVVMIALNAESMKHTQKMFTTGKVDKIYIAIVYGTPPWPTIHTNQWHTIDMPIGLVQDTSARINIRMVPRKDGSSAQTDAQVIATKNNMSLCRFRLHTGRQHQIRCHTSALGHPIVGDKLYAHGDHVFALCCDGLATKQTWESLLLPRHALHAATLVLPRKNGLPLRIDAPFPQDLRQFWAESGDLRPQQKPSDSDPFNQ